MKYRGGDPRSCRARDISKHGLAKCEPCFKRRVHCEWGAEIPPYMNPIKVAIHAVQMKQLFPSRNDVGVVEGAAVEDVEKDGEGCIGVKVEEDGGHVENTHISDISLQALGAALAARQMHHRDVIRSLLAVIKNFRYPLYNRNA